MHVPVHHRVSEHVGDPGPWLMPSGGSQIVDDPSRRAAATPHGSMFSPWTRSLNRGRLRVHRANRKRSPIEAEARECQSELLRLRVGR
jgi:hypothetical protein